MLPKIIMASPDSAHSSPPEPSTRTIPAPISRQGILQARAWRWLRGVAIALILFGVFGYFAAPPLLKSLLLRTLTVELQRTVEIARIDINPYALSIDVDGIAVRDEEKNEVFGLDHLRVNLGTASLWNLGVVVEEMTIDGPRVRITRTAPGHYDIDDLLAVWLAPTPESPTPRFSINNIRLSGGKGVLVDQPTDTVHTLEAISLALPFVSSLPYQADVWVAPHFSATLDGTAVVLEGKSKPFSETRESLMTGQLAAFDLTRLTPYLPAALPLRLTRGQLSGQWQLTFKQPPGQSPSMTVQGQLELGDVVLADQGGQALVSWKGLNLRLADSDLLPPRVDVETVQWDGLTAHLAVNAQGELNVLTVLEGLAPKNTPENSPKITPAATSTVQAPASPWRVGAVSLRDATVHWRDQSTELPVRGTLSQINLLIGAFDHQPTTPIPLTSLSLRADFGERFKLDQLALESVHIDRAARQVHIDTLTPRGLQLNLVRRADGQFDTLTPPKLKASPAASKEKSTENKAAAASPWQLDLARLRAGQLHLRLEDQRTPKPHAVQQLAVRDLAIDGLSTAAGKKARLDVSGLINQKGQLAINGEVQLSPFMADLEVKTQALPLLPWQPYFTEHLNIALTRGQFSNHGRLQLALNSAATPAEALSLRYQGSLTLGDLLTVDKLNNANFLQWKSLFVGGVDFQLTPMRVAVGEIALSDFFARAIVGPTGDLNLAHILRQPPAPVEAKEAPTAKAGTADAPAVPITIAKVTLQNGTVNFSDLFVKPNYSVNINQLGGRVTGLSSSEGSQADLELRGTYANSAPVSILAKLNPLAAQASLDLKADVSGVDLVPLSPYAGKYAGYNIEKGKLSLNVAYQLDKGKLAAQNRLFIDQLTFGEKVDSPTATSLPVNLAIALLKNNRGEIDLNLPISGSLDDPEFSVGGLVVKVIVNLFVKAVTSPFALLGSLFGGDESLSQLEFAPGRARLDVAAKQKLETLAKAMQDRNGLKLEISGRADPESDKEGLKWAAIDRAVRAEKQKEWIKKGLESGTSDSIEISDAEYPVYLERVYAAAKFPKPRNMIGLQKTLPREEMEKLLLTHLPAEADDVRQLAARRAERVQAWLIQEGKIDRARIFLLPPKVGAHVESSTPDKTSLRRVDFSLR